MAHEKNFAGRNVISLLCEPVKAGHSRSSLFASRRKPKISQELVDGERFKNHSRARLARALSHPQFFHASLRSPAQGSQNSADNPSARHLSSIWEAQVLIHSTGLMETIIKEARHSNPLCTIFSPFVWRAAECAVHSTKVPLAENRSLERTLTADNRVDNVIIFSTDRIRETLMLIDYHFNWVYSQQALSI